MKLYDYFKHLQNQELGSQRKAMIFSRIQKKKLNKLLRMSHFFSYKHFFYSLIVLVVAGVVFGDEYFDQTIVDNNIFRIDSLNNVLMAGKIAEIIDFEGEYQIEKDQQVIVSKYIQENSLIVLKENSSMVFQLHDETQGKIIGPAEFILSQEAGKYRINLLEGNFLTIFNEKMQNDLEVVTDDFILHQEKEEKVDLQIVKKENEVYLNNKGSNFTLIKDHQTSQESIIIEKEKTINIKDNDIIFLDNDEEVVQYIKEHNLTHTFLIDKTLPSPLVSSGETNDNLPSSDDFQKILQDLSGMRTSILSGNGEVIDFEIDLKETKKLPNEEQDHLLVIVFDDFFFTQEMEEIEQNISQSRRDKVERNQMMLAKEINDIISAFGLPFSYMETFEDIANLGSNFRTLLEEKYYVSPSLGENIPVLIEKARGFAQQWTAYQMSLSSSSVSDLEAFDEESVHGSAGTGDELPEENDQESLEEFV